MNKMRINQLKKFLEESPNDPFIHYGLALEYQKFDLEKTREKYNQLLEQYPEYLPTYYHAAHFFWEEGDAELTTTIFELGIELAKKQQDQNTLRELQNAYQNFQFEE